MVTLYSCRTDNTLRCHEAYACLMNTTSYAATLFIVLHFLYFTIDFSFIYIAILTYCCHEGQPVTIRHLLSWLPVYEEISCRRITFTRTRPALYATCYCHIRHIGYTGAEAYIYRLSVVSQPSFVIIYTLLKKSILSGIVYLRLKWLSICHAIYVLLLHCYYAPLLYRHIVAAGCCCHIEAVCSALPTVGRHHHRFPAIVSRFNACFTHIRRLSFHIIRPALLPSPYVTSLIFHTLIRFMPHIYCYRLLYASAEPLLALYYWLRHHVRLSLSRHHGCLDTQQRRSRHYVGYYHAIVNINT